MQRCVFMGTSASKDGPPALCTICDKDNASDSDTASVTSHTSAAASWGSHRAGMVESVEPVLPAVTVRSLGWYPGFSASHGLSCIPCQPGLLLEGWLWMR